MNRKEMKSGLHFNAAVDAASPNAWASAFDKMVYGNKRTGISETQNRSTFKIMDFPIIAIDREELRSLILAEV